MYFEVFSSTVIESKTKQINTKSWYKDFKDDLYQSLKVFSWEKSNFAEVIQKVPGDKTINSSICQHIICILKPKWMWLLNLENENISFDTQLLTTYSLLRMYTLITNQSKRKPKEMDATIYFGGSSKHRFTDSKYWVLANWGHC